MPLGAAPGGVTAFVVVGKKIDVADGDAIADGVGDGVGLLRTVMTAIAAAAATTSTTATVAGPNRLAGLLGGGAARRLLMD